MQVSRALLIVVLLGVVRDGAASNQCWCGPDTDYLGGDIGWVQVKTQQECCQLCTLHADCSVAVLWKQRCYLKHSSALRQPGTVGRIACSPARGKPAPKKVKVGSQLAALAAASCALSGCTASFDASQPCQCNKGCEEHGNCCFDFSAHCVAAESRTVAGILEAGHLNPVTCKAYGCGSFRKGAPCQCTAECAKYGNCCDDFASVCVGLAPGSAALSPTPVMVTSTSDLKALGTTSTLPETTHSTPLTPLSDIATSLQGINGSSSGGSSSSSNSKTTRATDSNTVSPSTTMSSVWPTSGTVLTGNFLSQATSLADTVNELAEADSSSDDGLVSPMMVTLLPSGPSASATQPIWANGATSLNQQTGSIIEDLPAVTTSDPQGNLRHSTITTDAQTLRKEDQVEQTTVTSKQADAENMVYDAIVATTTSPGNTSLAAPENSELIIRRFQLPPKEHAKSSLSYGQAEASATILALATVIGAGLWCMREERRFLEDCEDAEAVLDTELLPVSPRAPTPFSSRDLTLNGTRRVLATNSAF